MKTRKSHMFKKSCIFVFFQPVLNTQMYHNALKHVFRHEFSISKKC